MSALLWVLSVCLIFKFQFHSDYLTPITNKMARIHLAMWFCNEEIFPRQFEKQFSMKPLWLDVTRKKVKNWAEDPEWRCAEGSIGPVSASKQVLLTSMRGLGWLQAVMVLMINEFMKRGLHIGTSSISSILEMTAVEGLLWYNNNTVHLQGKFHFAPVPGAWIMTKYCCKTKSCDQIGHVLRSLIFIHFPCFKDERVAESRRSSTVLS